MNVLGIMSGTSLDGVDFVLCKIQKSPFQMSFLDFGHSKFPQKLKSSITKAVRHELKVNELALLHYDLGEFYAKEALKHKKNKKWKIDLVGLHGQTVFHKSKTASLQIGEASFLTDFLNCPVVCDFRPLDIALGGEGAPLATLFHRNVLLAATSKSKSYAIQNLGGIGNVTYINGSQIMSFDTGPANMLMDHWMQIKKKGHYDKKGLCAQAGIPDVHIVRKMLAHPFLLKTPPKSCGREEFGERFLKMYSRKLNKLLFEDQMATLLEFTAQSIALNYKKFFKKLPQTVYLCGGGAKNTYLGKRIQYWLPEAEVKTTMALGWPVDLVEGAAFALLAAHKYWQWPSNVPKTTGAKKQASLGKLI